MSVSATHLLPLLHISKLKFPFTLTKNQVEAVEAWIENDFRG